MRASVDCEVAGTNAGEEAAGTGRPPCRPAIEKTAKVAANARAATRSLWGRREVRVISKDQGPRTEDQGLSRGRALGAPPASRPYGCAGVGSCPGSFRLSCESNPSL